MFIVLFFFYWSGDHRDLHVLTHSFPTRRSSDLDLAIKTAFSGEVWLREVPLQRLAWVSAATVLDGAAPAALLRDRVVLLGATGSGLSPSFVTPSGAAVSAIEIQALFVENLLVGHHLLRPPFAVFWELLVTVLLLLGFLALRHRLPGQLGLVAVVAVLLLR